MMTFSFLGVSATYGITGRARSIAKEASTSIWHRKIRMFRSRLTGTRFFLYFRLRFQMYVLETIFCW